ncbi:MAG: VWA domain-containing protein [Bacteroidales bacterium]|nr:VWA domain-containing protein [Bacteroidales bacterium]MCF8387920.1 VWA domain-containing protein [Bacteroidales bacterium]MCF8396976.1 VWA domain-containing protein [Bacteroidales bacterium]
MKKYSLFAVFLFAGLVCQAQQQEEKDRSAPLTRILFVFDGSQSMYARWQSDIKINIARRLLSKILDSLHRVENLEMALRVYGHQHQYPPQVCDDTKLEVPFAENNYAQIKHRLRNVEPKGTTPMAYAIEQSAGDFPPCENCRNVVVLITDGIEECGGDPCAASRKLQEQGLILKPFIIGIGRNIRDELDCAGTYFDASSEEQFQKALKVVISQALNATTAQVNLLDENNKPTETNVNMTFYDTVSKRPKYNFIHTMNYKGLPDTLTIDPIPTYRLVVHTIPSVTVHSIKLDNGKHNTIAAKVPQGFLELKIDGLSGTIKDQQCIIRKEGKMQTIHVQNFETTEKYLSGVYDLEVLCLPRIYINSVEILPNHTTTVQIPMPGICVIKKTTFGYGSLYQKTGGDLKWIYNLRDEIPHQESLILQPGEYIVVFRSKYSDRSMYTIERSFEIKPGKTTNVKL